MDNQYYLNDDNSLTLSLRKPVRIASGADPVTEITLQEPSAFQMSELHKSVEKHGEKNSAIFVIKVMVMCANVLESDARNMPLSDMKEVSKAITFFLETLGN